MEYKFRESLITMVLLNPHIHLQFIQIVSKLPTIFIQVGREREYLEIEIERNFLCTYIQHRYDGSSSSDSKSAGDCLRSKHSYFWYLKIIESGV